MNNSFDSKNVAKFPLRMILVAPFVAQIIVVGIFIGFSAPSDDRQLKTTERNDTNNTNILMCLSALGVGVASSLYASRWITRPIKQLQAACGAVASGELGHQVEVDGIKEMGLLGNSFNEMSHQLKKSSDYLENINEELEIRLEERSIELQTAKDAMATAEIANKTREDLLDKMSLELRTPLNEISDYARTLQDNIAAVNQIDPENFQSEELESLKIVEQRSNDLLELLDDIVDFSEIKAKKIQLKAGNLHFPSLLGNIVETAKAEASRKNITVKYEANNGLPSNIRADGSRLRQVLTSLFKSAIAFTSEGTITLAVSSIQNLPAESEDLLPQRVIRFEIIANGVVQIDPAAEKIVSVNDSAAESQLDLSTLSLSLSKQIIELMGSELKLNRQANKGLIFWFDSTFAVTDRFREVKYDEVSQMLNSRKKKHKILVVDDIAENRQLLTDILEPMGFEVLIATNGKEGIEVACKTRPDLILTDLFMGVKTGFSMVQDLRQMPTFANLPIVAISASSFEVVEQQSKESGCDAFLQKPIDQNQLLSLLVQYLQLEWLDSDMETAFH